jgi:imidazolonepropionase-like amidohydrolase
VRRLVLFASAAILPALFPSPALAPPPSPVVGTVSRPSARRAHPGDAFVSAPQAANLALVGARIYPAPGARPIEGGVVLVGGGKVLAVAEHRDLLPLPPNTRFLDCAGLTLTAGFWNSHVHFTEPKWESAATMPARRLGRQLHEMFTRYGFTTVFDTGSLLENTQEIRRRIGTGEVEGPRILSTGPGFVPEGGTPFYVRPVTLPEVRTPEQAAEAARERLLEGADALKIFSAPTPEAGGPPLVMRAELVRAITSEAHLQGKPVFAHPENDAGVEAALAGGVDILAHTAPSGGRWSSAQVARMKGAGVALVPTLSLFKWIGESRGLSPTALEDLLAAPLAQVRAYAGAGGQILFGTDAGFVTDYDPTSEYRLMARAGMSFDEILASLTTSPAERFGSSRRAGQVAIGMEADLVLLSGDPATDIEALSRIRYVLQAGKLIRPGGR